MITRRTTRTSLARLLLAGSAALGAAGCGVGAGASSHDAKLVVTEDFGSRELIRPPRPKVGGSDTVMRFLTRNARVTTRFGGGFVQSIDGRAGGRSGARPVDWFYYVNGVEAEVGATQRKLRSADVVWWDRHDWGVTMTVPAVVGSFPEPLRDGPDAKRLPVRVECALPQSRACDVVGDRLTKAGVFAAKGGLQRSLTMHTLRVLVGPYFALRDDEAVRQLEDGPRTSGVYARPSGDGRQVAVLDQRGRVTQTLGAGSGLVAATRLQGGEPVWIVTGTDDAGVTAAASSLTPDALRNRFALAVSGARRLGLPVVTAG